MSALSKIEESIKQEISKEPETTEVVETTPGAETEEEPATIRPTEETAPEAAETKPVEETAHKPDLNSISDLDKATFSFKRQMQKQRSKYENDLADLRKQIEELKKPKESQKFRDNFQNDDEYIDYLVEQRFNKMAAARDEESRKKQAEIDAIAQQNKTIDENISRHFSTTEAREDYTKTVKAAFDQGLEELIDSEQYVRDYLMKSTNGPKILYEMAKDPQKVNLIFSQPDPMSRILEVKMLERELMMKPTAVANTQAPQATPAPQVPTPQPQVSGVVGKPGNTNTTTTDIFSDKKAMRDFLRRR